MGDIILKAYIYKNYAVVLYTHYGAHGQCFGFHVYNAEGLFVTGEHSRAWNMDSVKLNANMSVDVWAR